MGSGGSCRAVFLDRDGTINEDVGYLSDPEGFVPIDGALEAIALLKGAGFKVVVITNQSGLSRGLIRKENLRAIHERLLKMLEERGVTIDGLYYCPHLPEEGCNCRKPRTGLVERAMSELSIDPKGSYMVGDKVSDIELARNTGMRAILVLTGCGKESFEALKGRDDLAFETARNLMEAARWIVRDTRGSSS